MQDNPASSRDSGEEWFAPPKTGGVPGYTSP